MPIKAFSVAYPLKLNYLTIMLLGTLHNYFVAFSGPIPMYTSLLGSFTLGPCPTLFFSCSSLVITAVFDRNVNCRRAASVSSPTDVLNQRLSVTSTDVDLYVSLCFRLPSRRMSADRFVTELVRSDVSLLDITQVLLKLASLSDIRFCNSLLSWTKSIMSRPRLLSRLLLSVFPVFVNRGRSLTVSTS